MGAALNKALILDTNLKSGDKYHGISQTAGGYTIQPPDGAYESPSTIGIMCKRASKKVEGLEGFHFHQLRHTFTSNLLSNGAAPKDVQELLGHSDVSTTMNVYAHSTREAKRTSARLLDKVVGG